MAVAVAVVDPWEGCLAAAAGSTLWVALGNQESAPSVSGDPCLGVGQHRSWTLEQERVDLELVGRLHLDQQPGTLQSQHRRCFLERR